MSQLKCMNALFLQRLSDYQHSPLRIQSATVMIDVKINQSNILLEHFHLKFYPLTKPQTEYLDIPALLLYEARAAKYYWQQYRKILPVWTRFKSRQPYTIDITNKLLDIGYHHLGTIVKKIFLEKDCPPVLGLIHRAGKSDAMPLVYDVMEIFRADIIDMTVATWLRQKKKPIEILTQRQVANFLHDVNERLARPYYLRDFKQCHTYRYYMDIQITKLIKAINHQSVFKPIKIPNRHDTRCS